MSTLLMDVRYTVRMFLRSPGFVLVAVLSLALGIAVNTAIFSVVNAFLLGSAPYKAPDRLTIVSEVVKGPRGDMRRPPAIANVVDWAGTGVAFEDIGLAEGFVDSRTFIADSPAESVFGQAVSSNLFNVLGVQPFLGRTFQPREDTIILSYPFWQGRFGGDPSVLGTTVFYGGGSKTVIGVMPPRFFVLWGTKVDVWSSVDMHSPGNSTRKDHWFTAIGRLKPGVTIESAQEHLETVSARLASEYPETNRDTSAVVQDLRDALAGNTRRHSYILLGAVAFVLLIACANVANLLLARLAVRRTEMSVRSSLGATRSRLVRQMMTESLLLAILSGALGLLLTAWALDGLKLLVPRMVEGLYLTNIDPPVLAFTFALTVLTALLFGVVPAWQVSRWNLNSDLQQASRASSGRSAHRLRSTMVIVEVALSIVLLVGTGLMIRTLLQVNSVDVGFDPANLTTLQTQLAGPKYVTVIDQERELKRIEPAADLFYSRLLERVSALEQVESAAFTSDLPDTGSQFRTFTIAGASAPLEGERPGTSYYEVSPSFFSTLRIPVLRGRTFDENDRGGSPWTVVVDETFAARYFPNQNPVGQLIRFRFEPYKVEEDRPRMIIGVVGQVKFFRRHPRPAPVAYASDLQQPEVFPGGRTSAHLRRRLLIRSRSEAAEAAAPLLPAVRSIVADLDSQIPVMTVKSMDFVLAETETFSVYLTRLLAVFGIFAAILAAAGIYAIMSYFVTERTREIGIRMALGAQQSGVLAFVVRKALFLTAAGTILGMAAAAALTQLIGSWLYHVSAFDPLTYATVMLAIAAVAGLASYLPARRAAGLDPMLAIRHE